MGRAQHVIELTDRQREVLRLLVRGHTNGEIAEKLGISLQGAKWHVREILTKFGVESREELIEARPGRTTLRERVSRRWMAIPFVGASKAVLATVAVVAMAGAGVAAVAYGMTANGDEAVPAAAVTATPTPTSTPLPTATLPPAPGAVWAADDAYARAAEEARGLLSGTYSSVFVDPQDITDYRLESASWNPDITRFDSPNGDNYWDRTPARNVWAFMWTRHGVPLLDGQTNPIEVEILLEDGGEVLASRVRTHGPWMGMGFMSRAWDEQRMAEQIAQQPGGQIERFAPFDDDPASLAYLGAYENNGGDSCVAGFNADGIRGGADWCVPGNEHPSVQPIETNLRASFAATGEMTSGALMIYTTPEIVRVTIDTGDGRQLERQTYAPPAQSGIQRRFAWVNVTSVNGTYSVVGYNAAGAELYRAGEPAPTLPPELHGGPKTPTP